jgi:hypothetical protein
MKKVFVVSVLIALMLLVLACGSTATTVSNPTEASTALSTVASNATISTDTPEPPTPIPPTLAPQHGTVDNPIPRTMSEDITTTDASGNPSVFNIGIVDVVRGAKANAAVASGNMFNDKPTDGTEYILVKVKVTLKSGNIALTNMDFYVSSDGQIGDQSFVSGLDKTYPDLNAKLISPTSTTGWIVSLVHTDDTNPLLVYGYNPYISDMSNVLFFSTQQ